MVGSFLLELSKQQKLLQLMEERGFTLCQQNGQRTYGGPPPNWGSRPAPSRDSEVFIGRIPRLCFEDELIPLFLTAGELYEFRLMLDFSGTNRGYGYAHYATVEGAMKAIKTLNRYEIRPGHHIGVLKSKNNCRLLFGNINSSVTYSSFEKFIRLTTSQVMHVFMFSTFDQLKLTDASISAEVEESFVDRLPRTSGYCQYAVVEYENHKAAAVARRALIPCYGHILAIDWAIPSKEKRPRGQSHRSSIAQILPAVSSKVDKDRHSPVLFRSVNPVPTIRSPLKNQIMDMGNSLPLAESGSSYLKPYEVPVLTTQSSIVDNLQPTVNASADVIKFLKYIIRMNLQKIVDKGEIPRQLTKDIDVKIVSRITNIESCKKAVDLIVSYLSWEHYNILQGELGQFFHCINLYLTTLSDCILGLHSSRLNYAEEQYRLLPAEGYAGNFSSQYRLF